MITTINEFRKTNENNNYLPFNSSEMKQLQSAILDGNPQFPQPHVFHFILKESIDDSKFMLDYFLIKNNLTYDYSLYQEEDYENLSQVEPIETFNDLNDFLDWLHVHYMGTEDEDDNDLDPAGGRGLHSHESKQVSIKDVRLFEDKKVDKIKKAIQNKTKLKFKCGPANEEGIPTHISDDGLVTFKISGDKHPTKVKTKMVEGAVKRHWEEIMNAIDAKLPLKYKSGDSFGEAIPVEYKNNVVTFDNGINVIDMYVNTEINNINESLLVPELTWQDSSDGNGDLIADGVDSEEGFKNRYRIYKYGQGFILQVNGKNKVKGSLKLAKAAAQQVEKEVYKKNKHLYENVSSQDNLVDLFKQNNIDYMSTPQGELIVTVNFLHGDTDYWFDFNPNSGKYNVTEVIQVHMSDDNGDVEIGQPKSAQECIDYILNQQQIAKAELDSIPKITTTATPQPEQTGPKIVGKIDLPEDNKRRFKKK